MRPILVLPVLLALFVLVFTGSVRVRLVPVVVLGPRINVFALGVVLVFAFLAVPALGVALGRLLFLGFRCFATKSSSVKVRMIVRTERSTFAFLLLGLSPQHQFAAVGDGHRDTWSVFRIYGHL